MTKISTFIIYSLFVFDSIERKEDRKIIIGTLFNSARTEMVTVEFPLQQNKGSHSKTGDTKKKQKSQETNTHSVIKNGNSQLDGPPQMRPSTKEVEHIRPGMSSQYDDEDDEDDDDEFDDD